jgi:hypothetical protein
MRILTYIVLSWAAAAPHAMTIDTEHAFTDLDACVSYLRGNVSDDYRMCHVNNFGSVVASGPEVEGTTYALPQPDDEATERARLLKDCTEGRSNRLCTGMGPRGMGYEGGK